MNWKQLSVLFVTFLKMSPVTFGGGYAMIPVIEREVVDKRGWLRAEEVADVFAVAGSVPGAVAVNSAIFIGYRIAGVMGAIAALLGICLPTFCIVIGLTAFYTVAKDNPKIEAAFTAIRATVVALIVYAAIKIGKTAIVDFATGALAVAAVALLFFGSGRIHPAWLIVIGGAAGIIIVKIKERMGKSAKITAQDEQVYDYSI